MKRADRNVAYTEIELDKGIQDCLASFEFIVNSSTLENLLDGKFILDIITSKNFVNNGRDS
ncbi:hypothetical protein AAGF08_09270 [Algoriphagus sp. SE2]|uniref:hypothetical protein n=1 Tax=Algoriphagus sp. SE2 TaxID=3141536 RepID=UPI0031CD30DD